MKKAQLVLKALVMIVLTFLVFVPTVMFVVKFLGPSQAEDSFYKFVEDTNTFIENGKVGETKTKILILDEGMILLGFEKNKPVEYGYTYQVHSHLLTYHNFPYSQKTCSGKSCMCLCKDPECKKMVCKELRVIKFLNGAFDLGYKQYSATIKGDETTTSHKRVFHLKNGFIFERNKKDSKSIPYNTQYRRSVLKLKKTSLGELNICVDNFCTGDLTEYKQEPVCTPECTIKPNPAYTFLQETCQASCDGINGCKFYNDMTKKACDRQSPTSSQTEGKYLISCCEGEPVLKPEPKYIDTRPRGGRSLEGR